MPRKAAEQAPVDNSAVQRCKLQKFETRDILRSAINPAPYNPRQLSAYAKKGLKKSLTDFGLVETPIWNEATGNLVGGHQRLSIIDEEQGYDPATKSPDYLITVSVVNLAPKAEKKLNILLNNRAAQGTFEKDAFVALIKEAQINLDDVHFTRADLEFEMGNIDELFEATAKSIAIDEIRQTSEAMNARRKEFRDQQDNDAKHDAEYFLVMVFDSGADKNAWLRKHGFAADAEYVAIREVEAALERPAKAAAA